jgi:hypothetical protein
MHRIFSAWLASLLLAGCVGTDILPDTVRSIVARAPQASLRAGDSLQLSALLVNTFGDEFEGPLSWVNDSPQVAALSEQGLLRGLAPGQARIYARNDSLSSNLLLITVFSDASLPAEIRVSGSASLLNPGDSLQLSAELRNAAGELIGGYPLSWASSDPSVLSVDTAGLVRALRNGQAAVTASAGGILSQPYAIQVGSASRSGSFGGRNGYSVSGSVSLSEGPSGLLIALGSNFQSQSGPGLYVYLSNSAHSANGGVEIAKLRKTSGADSYAVPAGIALGDYNFVLIQCKPFNVTFGSAQLQ